MIRNSFIFLKGIGIEKEKRLWNLGIKNWDDFLERKKISFIPADKKGIYDKQIAKAKEELYALNSKYFADLLPKTEHWRLYDFFKEEAVFLDIETTGIDAGYITLIGLFDGINTKTMVRGINLDIKQLKGELCKYKLIVTFNGASFDLPYIEKRFPKILPKLPHFDLRHACAKIGLTGGLKEIEKRLGIKRNKIVKGLNGGDALTLWKTFKATGDEYYLKLLIEYNEEDVINLRFIADFVSGKLKENLFIVKQNTLKNVK